MTSEYTGGISGYQVEAARTGSSAHDPTDPEASLLRNLALAGMGLTGEAGEVCDLLKKVVFHGKPLDADVRAKLLLEMGDVLWYLAHAATTLGVTLDDVANANAAKLRARFPDGFTCADAAAKRDEAGR